LQKIQTLYPKGPYSLVGMGMSSCVAFQLALEMQRQGHTVEHLIFLNGTPLAKPSGALRDLRIHRNLLYAYLAVREYIPVSLDKVSSNSCLHCSVHQLFCSSWRVLAKTASCGAF
jgi:thioesterase domain-containing protein